MSTHNHDSNFPGVLASSSVQGEVTDLGATAVATTTKHPRHRPGCSCIVCIQPPSGKGKHKPTCTCNVCMTVKRRFKTLMLRKKKRQSDREAEIAQRNQFLWGPKEEVEVDSTSQGRRLLNLSENGSRSGSEPQAYDERNNQVDRAINANTDKLDLNFQPNSGEDLPIKSTQVSMISLVQVATRPLEMYLKQNGLTSLIPEQQTSSGSHVPPQDITESEGHPHQDQSLAQEDPPGSDDKVSEADQTGTNLDQP